MYVLHAFLCFVSYLFWVYFSFLCELDSREGKLWKFLEVSFLYEVSLERGLPVGFTCGMAVWSTFCLFEFIFVCLWPVICVCTMWIHLPFCCECLSFDTVGQWHGPIIYFVLSLFVLFFSISFSVFVSVYVCVTHGNTLVGGGLWGDGENSPGNGGPVRPPVWEGDRQRGPDHGLRGAAAGFKAGGEREALASGQLDTLLKTRPPSDLWWRKGKGFHTI